MNRRKFLKLFGGAAVALPAAAIGLAKASESSNYEPWPAGAIPRRRSVSWAGVSDEIYGRGPMMSATEVLRRQNEMIRRVAHDFEKATTDLAVYGTW